MRGHLPISRPHFGPGIVGSGWIPSCATALSSRVALPPSRRSPLLSRCFLCFSGPDPCFLSEWDRLDFAVESPFWDCNNLLMQRKTIPGRYSIAHYLQLVEQMLSNFLMLTFSHKQTKKPSTTKPPVYNVQHTHKTAVGKDRAVNFIEEKCFVCESFEKWP